MHDFQYLYDDNDSDYRIGYGDNLVDLLCPMLKSKHGHVIGNNFTEGRSFVENIFNTDDIFNVDESPNSICNSSFYNSNRSYFDYEWISEVSLFSISPERIFLPLIFGMTFLIGIVGNSIVIYVVLKSKVTKTVTNMYLLNLAISDLLMLILCLPVTAMYYLLNQWVLGTALCKLANYVLVVAMGTSILTLTAMSIDRYHAVVLPVKSKTYRTPLYTGVILAAIWVLNLASLVPQIFIAQVVDYYDMGPKKFCLVVIEKDINRKIYYLCLFVFYYVGPLCIIAVTYSVMARRLWSSVSPGFLQDNTAKALRCRKRVSKMVLAVVLVFATCWLPVHALNLKKEFGSPIVDYLTYSAKIVALCLSFINSAANPVVYAFMSENFRTSFRAAFRCDRLMHSRIFLLATGASASIQERRTRDNLPQVARAARQDGAGSSDASNATARNDTSVKLTTSSTAEDLPMAGGAGAAGRVTQHTTTRVTTHLQVPDKFDGRVRNESICSGNQVTLKVLVEPTPRTIIHDTTLAETMML